MGPSRDRLLRTHAIAAVLVLVVAPVPALLARACNYTWSLLLFLLPSTLILGWFLRSKDDALVSVRRAFLLTLGLLVPMGFVLNFLFAGDFFSYPNSHAVLGIYLPGLRWRGFDWSLKFPLEELLFYGFGFLSMLLVYLWADAFFLRREQASPGRYREQGSVVQLAVGPGLVALAVVVAGWLFKHFHGGGFPGYLAFLMLVPFVVALALYRVARALVNWPAFLLMLLYVLGTSVLWEVSLALPGGWWRYRPAAMVGLFVARWSDLPVEAVLVWFLAAFATVVVFEAAKVFVHHPATALGHKLFASPAALPVPAPGPGEAGGV